MYWDPGIETLSRRDLEVLQLRRINSTVAKAAQSPFYRRLFAEQGINAAGLGSLAEVSALPFTTKDDLRSDEAYPYGFLTVDREHLVRLHSSSGTTGRPTTIFHTRRDIETWADLVAR